MILKSFLLGNLVSLCMKIINSVVVVGLYYGFMTTFSIGPSYLFLLQARVMEEGTEKKVSATAGFITGQLMMFISIYYAPLHLALGRPHTITVLALPYLLFHFFWNNHKHFFDYGSTSTTRNSMRNLSIQCVFLNNLIFQLFNHFILPSSMLARLVNISMFRCNNKMLFVTSSFVGWLIGHILFMKWVGLVLVWIRQNHSIRSNVLIRSNKYLVSEVRNSMARIFSILLFITCVYDLGRIPSPILTKKLKETSETKERGESEEETDIEIETTFETKETKEEQEGSTEEDPSPSLFSEEKEDQVYETSYPDGNQENSTLEILQNQEEKNLFWFEKPLVTLLFDYKQRKRPFRYIKKNRFENSAIKTEMSQYFFYTCRSDGKQRISFTYPPSLSTFLEMIQRKMLLSITEKKKPSAEFYNNWIDTNKQKENHLSNEFLNRIEILDRGFLTLDVLEKRIRLYLCNEQTQKEYLPKKYDPFLNGPYRGKIKFDFFPSILNKISTRNSMEIFCINKIHGILLATGYQEFEQKTAIDMLDRKLLSASNFHLKNFFVFPEPEQGRINSKSKDQTKFLQLLFTIVIKDPNDQTTRKKSVGLKEIHKKVPRWSYKLISDLEYQEDEDATGYNEIRSRKAKRVVIFTDNQQNSNTDNNESNNPDQADEISLIRYSQQSDFRRNIIKGSVRAKRRKTPILEPFQANAHSPLFLDRIDKVFFFSFDIFGLAKFIFRNWMGKNTEFKISDYVEEERKEKGKEEVDKREEKARIEIAESWDSILFAQAIRGFLLLTQSILRKYIILPSLIITKNVGRMLLFQFPEWSEDFKDWNREMYVKCTYNGVQLSETEFPKNWLKDGIQIKILFPFCLKPWHGSKPGSSNKDPMKNKGQKADFCFLTIWGMEAKLPFGSPRKRPSFFEPLLKEFRKKIRKWKKTSFLVLKEKKKIFLTFSKETKKWIIKRAFFIKRVIKELSKRTRIPLFGLQEVYESIENQNEKDSTIINNNRPVDESSIQIQSTTTDWTNYSLIEKKTKNLANRTRTIRNQIEKIKITKDKKKESLTSEINIIPKKKNSNAKRFDQNIWQILKRRNTRLIRKSNSFIKFFSERIRVDILLCINNIPRINTQIFRESTQNIFNKYIYNNETNQERIDKTNQNTIDFIKSISNKNSNFFCDLFSLSQAYVFYKISQTQVINLYKLRSVLQYQDRTSLFFKNEIKDYFGVERIFHSELKHNKLLNSRLNQWKNWLRGHYQYNLSQIRWSRLVPQKWRNRVNPRRMAQNKDFNKGGSYQKENDSKANPLPKKKKNLKKHYRYDLLSYKFINYEDKTNSYIYESPLQVNNNQEISYNYNTHKRKFLTMLKNLFINNYPGQDNSTDTDFEKNPNRKYFDWRILHFCLRNKVDIEAWVNIDTNSNKTTKASNYQKVNKTDKKEFFSITIQQDQKSNPSNKKRFDWMGMNEEILNRPISNLELWFFSEFVLLYNAYKKKPWVIPIKLLLLNFTENGNVSENIKEEQKGDFFKSSNEKKWENNEKKETAGQGDVRLSLSNQEKDIEKDYTRSKIIKHKKKKSNTEIELNFLLKKYLLFQLRWDDSVNQRILNNIKVYCLLLRVINPKEITISSIHGGEMSLDIMLTQKNLSLAELIKKGILVIEPIRLSVKNDGQFLMYQTISISSIQKSKHQINQRYEKKKYVDKKSFKKCISRHRRITGNRDKNHYDLLIPENILSSKRRRELRILICFNSKNRNGINKNPVFWNVNNIKNCDQVLDERKPRDKDKLIKLKFFLWPNYRLEDLACINRYWFDTNNGSRFSMIRIRMYPLFKIG
uniref:Protein TIC 214 n=3 Tax=Paeonia brownii TaxID=40702 RepID=A0A2S1P3Y0_9MAGN|nr:hypothetical chloroplast RF19 [Paeonia brownii]AFM83731.1 hypothetical chloroplast RF19 [Paeonia brownii]AWH11154.1 hypothetical chloroplast RF19 [Paeonia brownii]